MFVMTSPDDASAAKRQLRARGWYVRYTEWPSGHQVVLHLRSDTAVHLVTSWWLTEAEAFDEALSMATAHELRSGRPASVAPSQPPARSREEGTPAPAETRRRDLDVAVVGNAQDELVIRAPRLPTAGEMLEGDLFSQAPGGKGARQAIAAARFGARVALVARVGADRAGDDVVARLREEGVGTEHIVRDPEARTGVALVHLDRRARRSGAVAEGASRALSRDDVRSAEEVIRCASVVVGSLDVSAPCLAEAFRIARRHGTHAVLDAAPPRKVSGGLLALVDVAIVTAGEAGLLTGVPVTGRRSALNAARSLLRRGAGAVVLRTPRFTLHLTRSDEVWIPAASARDADMPEAGDAFCGALAVALAEGLDLARAGQLASAAAAITASRSGVLPTRAEVMSFAEESPRPEELVLDGILPADALRESRESPGHPPG
jgi:ribokinase